MSIEIGSGAALTASRPNVGELPPAGVVPYSSCVGRDRAGFRFSPLISSYDRSLSKFEHGNIQCPEGAISPWNILVPGGIELSRFS